jgi:hypothetical protein
MLVLGSTIRLGYGLARYHGSLSDSGSAFITRWDFDALEHVLISKSLIEDHTYTVARIDGLDGKHVRALGHGALFKAPLYEAFLALVFALSGFTFTLFFPLQAILGGVLSGLAALIALDSFDSRRVAYFAGVAAATHPILVNTASQPYNENLFFALLFGSIWAFSRWLHRPVLRWAIVATVLGALAGLCRETALPLLLIMIVLPVFVSPPGASRLRVPLVMLATATLVIAPWSLRNYIQEHAVIPVASNTGTALGIGNNACLAAERILSPYWADGPCPSLDVERLRLLARLPADQRMSAVREDRIYGALGIQFIREHPITYLRFCLGRAWTGLLPFHPRQALGRVPRIALSLYWLAVIPAGFVGAFISLRKLQKHTLLLLLLIAATLSPLILIYFSSDMRYRVGADLLLAAFAGWVYVNGSLRLRRPLVRELAA